MSPSPVDPSFLFFFFCCCLVSQELASAKQRPADGTDLHYAARCPLLLLLRCDRLHAPSEKLRQPARPFPRLVSACAAAARTRPNTYPPSTWQPPDNSPVRDLFLFLFFFFFALILCCCVLSLKKGGRSLLLGPFIFLVARSCSLGWSAPHCAASCPFAAAAAICCCRQNLSTLTD